MELQRWRDFLGIPINVQPKFFPSSETLSAACVIALRETMGDKPAIAFSSPSTRGWLKWVLVLSLLVAWVALGFAVKDIVLRTSATLITPRGVHQPPEVGRPWRGRLGARQLSRDDVRLQNLERSAPPEVGVQNVRLRAARLQHGNPGRVPNPSRDGLCWAKPNSVHAFFTKRP